MSKTYFAVDGSYGDGDGIVIADTTYWTDEDFDAIDNETDYYRPQLALEIADKYRKMFD